MSLGTGFAGTPDTEVLFDAGIPHLNDAETQTQTYSLTMHIISPGNGSQVACSNDSTGAAVSPLLSTVDNHTATQRKNTIPSKTYSPDLGHLGQDCQVKAGGESLKSDFDAGAVTCHERNQINEPVFEDQSSSATTLAEAPESRSLHEVQCVVSDFFGTFCHKPFK